MPFYASWTTLPAYYRYKKEDKARWTRTKMLARMNNFRKFYGAFFVPTLERLLVSWRQVGEAFVSGTAVVGEFQNVLGCPWFDLLSA